VQLSLVKFQLCNFWRQNFVQKMRTYNFDEIDDRGIFPSAIVVAELDSKDLNKTRKISEKVKLISDHLKDGTLLFLQFGILFDRNLTTFTTKTVIVTGK